MSSRTIISEILNSYNFNNYEVEIGDKGSRCDFHRNQKTTIYIHESANQGNANSIIVAAHEASHALNYNERITNNILLKALEKLMKVFTYTFILLCIIGIILLLFHHTMPKVVVCISLVLHYIFSIWYCLYNKGKSFGPTLKEIQNESHNRLYRWIYLKSLIMLITLIVIPILLMFFLSYLETNS